MYLTLLADATRRLHLLIDACACDAQATNAFLAGNHRDGYAMEMLAMELAASAAETAPAMPPMFRSRPALSGAWSCARHRIARHRQREQIAAQIAAADWPALGVPEPVDLLRDLLAARPIRINGASLQYEAEYDITWYQNAYGVENVWCQHPDLQSVTRFVAAALQGKQFGPCPE